MSWRVYQKEWEELANLDPYWAVLSHPHHKFGKWDSDEFFLTGDREIARVLEFASQLGYLSERELALDFGCGIGRLTRALARHFQQCIGVDISEKMVARANELNCSFPNCKFIVNKEENLNLFPDSYFDIIYTNIVLQHIPYKSTIKSYIAEFGRTLKECGLLVFQLPSHIPIKNRIQPRSKAYALLRLLGFNEKFLYEKLDLHPMKMNFLPEKEVANLLNIWGGKVLHIQPYSIPGTSFLSNTYYVTK
jgi:ubiquinone/menaquinone biosynthesis C-methylase UbiE